MVVRRYGDRSRNREHAGLRQGARHRAERAFGRGPAKTPFVAAVETADKGGAHRVKLTPVRGFRKAEIKRLVRRTIAPGSIVVSDGLSCFSAIAEAGCDHHPMITGGGPRAVKLEAFK